MSDVTIEVVTGSGEISQDNISLLYPPKIKLSNNSNIIFTDSMQKDGLIYKSGYIINDQPGVEIGIPNENLTYNISVPSISYLQVGAKIPIVVKYCDNFAVSYTILGAPIYEKSKIILRQVGNNLYLCVTVNTNENIRFYNFSTNYTMYSSESSLIIPPLNYKSIILKYENDLFLTHYVINSSFYSYVSSFNVISLYNVPTQNEINVLFLTGEYNSNVDFEFGGRMLPLGKHNFIFKLGELNYFSYSLFNQEISYLDNDFYFDSSVYKKNCTTYELLVCANYKNYSQIVVNSFTGNTTCILPQTNISTPFWLLFENDECVWNNSFSPSDKKLYFTNCFVSDYEYVILGKYCSNIPLYIENIILQPSVESNDIEKFNGFVIKWKKNISGGYLYIGQYNIFKNIDFIKYSFDLNNNQYVLFNTYDNLINVTNFSYDSLETIRSFDLSAENVNQNQNVCLFKFNPSGMYLNYMFVSNIKESILGIIQPKFSPNISIPVIITFIGNQVSDSFVIINEKKAFFVNELNTELQSVLLKVDFLNNRIDYLPNININLTLNISGNLLKDYFIWEKYYNYYVNGVKLDINFSEDHKKVLYLID